MSRKHDVVTLSGDEVDDMRYAIESLTAERDRLREELAGLKRSLAAAKTLIESKDKAYSLIQQRWDAMAAKAATVDSERECNGRLTAEIDRLSAELAELRAQEPVAWEYTMPISGERIASVKQTLLPNERPLFAAPVPAAVPSTEPFLQFNLTQALALVDSFGGCDGDMAVSWFDKAVDEEGEPMPSGLYAYCYDYPEEGRQWLGDPLAEIEAWSEPAAVPALQRFNECGGSMEPDPVERLRCFLSAALSPQDWVDVEPFLAALVVPAAVPDDEITKTRLKMEIKRACEYYQQAGRVESVAPMLARQHKHTADKIIDTALAAAQKKEGES